MNEMQQRYLHKQVADYHLIANQLYHRGKDNQLQICVTKCEYLEVLTHAHSSILGGHFLIEVMAKTIVRARLWWPTLL